MFALKENIYSGGELPRNFAIISSVRYLIVANQGTSSLVVFERDVSSGSLRKISQTFAGTPMRVKIWRQSSSS
ncbi:beta-propeller fold lactonase family protein [Mesorhizobium sp.]